MTTSKPIPVEIIALVEEENSQTPIVVLYDKKSNRILPIWIGDMEAKAIAVILNQIPTPRPLTHELLLQSIQAMDGEILRIVIDRMEDQTYYATVYVDRKDKGVITLDARPSDSIALALRSKAPIFVEEEIMAVAGQINVFPLPNVPKMQQEGPRKIQLTKQDIDRISSMLEQARDREQKS